MAKKQFKAESKRLLDLMINSIYTHKEIFLREIVSNASDALDKLCYSALGEEGAGVSRSDLGIKLAVDRQARTLTVSDNGIGMTKEELESNLGVIAGSGSLKFKSDMDASRAGDIDIIGQFGVGFYSAFMVSENVTVISRAFGAQEAYRWESSGADGYTVTACERAGNGTDVIMKIKTDTEDEKYSEFLDSWRIRELVRKYSDYIRYPIRMDIEKTVRKESAKAEGAEEDADAQDAYETVTEETVVNSMVPIWQRAKSEVTEEDYKTFYREQFHDYEEPAAIVTVNAEGVVSYRALLFIPSAAPFDFYTREYEAGLSLYSSGVMIMQKCADLLPEHFRFVRGVVDTQDLSLNISRELLQHNRQLKVIASNLEKRIKSELLKLMKDSPEKYEKFYASFGSQLKYGAVSAFGKNKEMLKDLLMFYSSSQDKPTTFADYLGRVKEGQKYIYYACGDSVSKAAQLPQVEPVLDAGYEVLYLIEHVDEFVVQVLEKLDDKEFKSVNSDDLGLEGADAKEDVEKKEEENRELLDFCRESLDGAVASVKLSRKLKTHPVCLSAEGSITLDMEKYFSELPVGEGSSVKAERVLEINASHPAFEALKRAYSEDRELAKKYIQIMYYEAVLIAGMPLEEPAKFADLVCGIMK